MLAARKLDCGVLVGAVALTRFLFRSDYLYDLDSVNFALAMRRFDPSVHQPHPPGYFLYVWLGRLANLIFHDANAALVAISIVASCGAAVMIYVLADEWFGRLAARFAGLLFLFSPLAWFHGTVALTYIVEAFFSALIGYICWRFYCGSARWVLPGAAVLGIAAGVRPSSLLFLGPLFLVSVSKTPRRWALAGLGVLLLTLLAWFVPMIYASGGPGAYFGSLALLWRMAPGRQNGLSSVFLLAIARACTVAFLFLLCLGSASLLFARVLWTAAKSERQKKVFTWVWIAPALLFFTLVFLRFVNGGYLLLVFPPVCAWVAAWAADWYSRLRLGRSLKLALVGLAASANIAIFLFAPLYCSYREVQRFEAELKNVQRALPQIASPERTLIVAFDSHFLGFRHAGYYFPEYAMVEYPEVRLSSGNRVFTMQQRDTRLADRIATNHFANFVLFPLPREGSEYQQYLSQMKAKFSASDLRAVEIAGCQFIIGPVGELTRLFPSATERPVYTAHDVTARAVYKR